ncbi:MAG: hypothetical protein HYZ15_10575 [Sphingobacteriales bacterium]|nr:hypothetical protein [Sphingobacteriales bacterium]
MEVYETYFHYYNHNLSIADIKERLKSDFAETISNMQTANDYWFALAKALWECKELDTYTFEKVKAIIESRLDLKIWRELEASEKDLKAREKALANFLATISTEKEKPKARKKIIYYSGYYDKGTCLAIKMKNGNYGGLLVLEKEYDTLEGANYVAATNINLARVPTTDDFKKAKILTGRHTDSLGYFREYFWIFVFEAKYKRYNKEIDNCFINVGTIPIGRVFEKHFETPFQHSDIWTHWINVVEEALNKISNGEKENISATVEEWINNTAANKSSATRGA